MPRGAVHHSAVHPSGCAPGAAWVDAGSRTGRPPAGGGRTARSGDRTGTAQCVPGVKDHRKQAGQRDGKAQPGS